MAYLTKGVTIINYDYRVLQTRNLPLYRLSIPKRGVAMGRGGGGGQMVNLLVFYFNDPSLNPAESTVFVFKMFFEKNENK